MTNSPHDRIFKSAFERPEYAAAELRHILPPTIVRALDWSSLRLEPGSYVDTRLADSHSDLLFSARLGERTAFVYLLFEHQSASDPFMAMRLLAYMVRIWGRHHAEHPGARLPVIVPAVLAQVPCGWTAATRFADLFDLETERDVAELRAFVPDFTYVVDDLGIASDDELAARGLADFPSLALWLMRDVRNPDALLHGLERRAAAFDALLHGPNGAEFVIRLLRYVALAADDLPFERFYAKVKQLAPAAESYLMTIAQQLHSEGLKEGRSEGLKEGRSEGLAKGRSEGLKEGAARGLRNGVLALCDVLGISMDDDRRKELAALDAAALTALLDHLKVERAWPLK
jgi:predicted transposase YdaD